MTITTQANVVTAQGNGATPIFSYNFLIPDTDDVEVIYTDTLGNTTTLTPSQYTISGIGNVNGGTVTYPIGGPTPIASGTSLTIARILPLVQDTSMSNQGAFYTTAVEDALDYLTMLVQQINNIAGRALITSIVDPAGPLPLPPIAQRANQILGFDGNGNPIAAQPASALVSTVMAPVVDAGSLAIARTALGLGAAATENLGGNIIDDGHGNLILAPGAITPGNIQSAFANLTGASITDLGTIPSQNVNILGSATILSFGSSAALTSPLYYVTFAGASVVTYNATSLILPTAANINTSPGDAMILLYLGSGNWQALAYFPAANSKALPDLWVRDQETSGTAAGTSSSSAYVTRVLNTVKRNVIVGASLTSNQVTLPAGTYYARWYTPACNILNGAGCASQSRLQNITDGTTIEVSQSNSSFFPTASIAAPVDCQGTATFTLAATKVIALQHFVTSGCLYGRPSNSGSTEIYASLEIWKAA